MSRAILENTDSDSLIPTSAPPSASQRTDLIIGASLFVAALALYVSTMTPGLGGGIDSAEFQHAAYELSIVHPTGYPLYLLLARAFIALFPFGEIAWRVTLLSALFCAATLPPVYAIICHLTRNRWAAVFGAVLVAVHALVWRQATVAEVNSLNLLLVALFFYALLRWAARGAADRPWPLEVAGLLFGLALANHRVSLFVLPGIILFVGLSVRAGVRLRPATVLRTVGAILLPLLLYLYIPLRADTTAWYSNNLTNFLNVVGGESAIPVIRDTLSRPLLPRLRIVFEALFGHLSRTSLEAGQLHGPILLLGLIALIISSARWWTATLVQRAVLALFLPTALLVSAVMVVYDVDVIGDYLSMVVLILSILAAIGLVAFTGTLSAWLKRRGTGRTVGYAVAALWLLLFAGVGWNALALRPQMDHSSDQQARKFWDAVQQKQGATRLADHALLISPWNRYNELRYLQTVEGWRRDLEPVVLDDIVAGGRLGLIDDWLAQGRAIYLLEGTPDILDQFTATQQGVLWRIDGRGHAVHVPMQHEVDVRLGDSITLVGYTLQPPQVQAGGQLKITLFWQTEARLTERYVVFTHLIDANGGKIGQRDDEPGRGYRPTVNWQPGQLISDSLVMTIDPAAPPGTYRLMVGMYERMGETRLPVTALDDRDLGDYWQMAQVVVVR